MAWFAQEISWLVALKVSEFSVFLSPSNSRKTGEIGEPPRSRLRACFPILHVILPGVCRSHCPAVAVRRQYLWFYSFHHRGQCGKNNLNFEHFGVCFRKCNSQKDSNVRVKWSGCVCGDKLEYELPDK